MQAKVLTRLLPMLLMTLLLVPSTSPQSQSTSSVSPAKLVRVPNFETEASRSNRPAYLPREWGRLVSVQRLDEAHLMLILQADGGEIYFVRMIQRGGYLYLDTVDQGGVASVLRREP
jgi:hypothetical protein